MTNTAKNGHTEPLPICAWWSMASTAISDLEQARRFGVNVLIVEDDTQYDWGVVIDALALYEFSDHYRREGARRERVEVLRAHYRTITEVARQCGILSYIMCSEIFLLDEFDALRSYDNPGLWTLVYERLSEVFRALPCLDGFMLYMDGARPSVVSHRLPGSESSMVVRYARLIDTVWQACQAEGRKLLVTTYVASPDRLEAVTEALRRMPPHKDLAIVQYCCPNDWGLYGLVNPSIGRVGPHQEILAFDYAAENWGQGTHPFVQVDFMAQRLRAARERGAHIAGLVGYVAWYGRSVLGTLNEVNIWAGASLVKAPERDAGAILHDWCAEWFGESAAKIAARSLARTCEVAFKTHYVLGYSLDTTEKSGLPSLEELQKYLIENFYGMALYNWDSQFRSIWDKIQVPDRDFLAEVIAEKDEAINLCRVSLVELRAARDVFREEDFDDLERAFVFQERWARLWRAFVHAFFLHRIGIVQGSMQRIEPQLKGALADLASEADKMEEEFGKDVFPRGPGRAREFIRDLTEAGHS